MTTTTRRTDDGLIRKMLAFNAMFSGFSGVLALLFGAALGDATDISPSLVRLGGVGLIGYAGLLLVWARRETFRPIEGWAAIVGDRGWVAATIVVLIAFPDTVNMTGKVLLVAIAIVVAGFAEGQWMGMRRLGSAAGSVE